MVQGKLDTGDDCNTGAADVPVISPESDSEDFEDVLPRHSVTGPGSPATHDISIRLDVRSSEPQGSEGADGVRTPALPSFTRSVHKPTPLPRPRTHPLPPGGAKEASLIFYLDRVLDNLGKRITNRHVKDLLPGELPGYTSFAQAVKDLDSMVDVVWVSGTPTLQLPYLITIAVSIINYLPMFPPLPRTTLGFLRKLDTAFAALLSGYDPETSEPLPGLSNCRGISITDKIRLKGVVERARSTVTKHLVSEETADWPVVGRNGDGPEKASEGFVKFEGFDDDDDDSINDTVAHRFNHQDVAHVFEKTIMELGDLLGGEAIGLVTDEERDMRRQFEEEAAALREQGAIKEWYDEQDATDEQMQYVEDGRKEFEDEARWLGDDHGFRPHGVP